MHIQLVGSLIRRGRLTDILTNRIMSSNKLIQPFDALLSFPVIGWYGTDIAGWGLPVALIGRRMLPVYGFQRVIKTAMSWAGTAQSVLGLGRVVRLPAMYRHFSLLRIVQACYAQSEVGASSADVRRSGRQCDKSPQSNAETKNERNPTSNPTHAVMAWAATAVTLVTDYYYYYIIIIVISIILL